MTTPGDGPGTLRAHLDAAVASAGFQLTKDNVLFFRDAIVNEANRIRNDLKIHRTAATTIPLLGGDPVSYDASQAFPIKLNALMDDVDRFANDLEDAAQALNDTARSYGLTEEEIARNFTHAVPTTTTPHLDDAARGSSTGELLTRITTASPASTRQETVPGSQLSMDRILNADMYGAS